ncbi:MAG: YidC/Oxa1 family membrane protein insertase [bacterium]|nr:YidC/Oxa1 family membrane protein insertase [bacterium]
MISLYNTYIYEPLYNGLILLIDYLPFLDAGIIIIIFTIIVRIIIFPLSKKAARTQVVMKALEPELNALKERHKDDKQGQAVAIMGFYKKNGINPFSSIFLLIIQLPIIFALYKIFYSTGLSAVNGEILYSFVAMPAQINTAFLGLFDVTQKSVVLAVIAAASQFLQIHFSMPKPPAKTGKGGFQEDFARSMHMQMKYVFPIFILFIGYHAAGALAIYWTTSNIFMIAQEIYVRRELAKEMALKEKKV